MSGHRYLMLFGMRKTVAEWSRELSISADTMYWWLHKFGDDGCERRVYERLGMVEEPEKIYSLYEGDRLEMVGTMKQVADWRGVTLETAKRYACPRNAGQSENAVRAYAIDEMEVDGW